MLTLHRELQGEIPDRPPKYLAELLRAALVFAMSSFDNYVHAVVVERLSRGLPNPTPPALQNFTFDEWKKDKELVLRIATSTKPLEEIVSLIEITNSRKSFQHPVAVAGAFELIGLPFVWGQVATKIEVSEKSLKDLIVKYYDRRNQIAHEADVIPKTRKTRSIRRSFVEEVISTINRLVKSIDDIVEESLAAAKPRPKGKTPAPTYITIPPAAEPTVPNDEAPNPGG